MNTARAFKASLAAILLVVLGCQPAPPLATITFAMGEGAGRGDLIYVPVMVAGKERLFNVDTGAENTVLDKSLEGALGSPRREITVAAPSGNVKLKVYRAPEMRIAGSRIHLDPEVIVADFTPLQEMLGKPVAGTLGWDCLRNYVVKFDFRRCVVELMDPANFAVPQAGDTVTCVPMGEKSNIATVAMPFLGLPQAQPVSFDTGCNSAGHLSAETLAQLGGAASAQDAAMAVDAAGKNSSASYLIQRQWTFAGTSFDELVMLKTNANRVGLRVMADYVMTLDYPARRAYFENIREAHPAAWPQRGFNVLSKGGKMVVDYPSEAAQALNIRDGDELVAVEGKDIAGREVWAIKEEIDAAKAPVLKLRREGREFEVTLRRGG